ncbi:MAG: GGDEF domain-containing protein [Acidobacteria bacterium]|jgi:diguanylate cyclase (GGDEF)-like protein|nr:GGDEF domain-containing protein [Acidobacteriota bacterium]
MPENEKHSDARLGPTLLGGLASIAVLGAIDHATGVEISFSIFYLAPIGVAAWVAGRKAGLPLAVAAALVWGLVEREEGLRFSSPLIPFWNALVRLGFFLITAWLISEVRRMHARERHLARRDALTGVANARSFLEAVDREIARMHRSGAPLTLAYVDLDRFKGVNDTLGHAAGDQLLREVATRLTGSVRAVDVVARLGGDEFAMLFPETGAGPASVALERCLDTVRAAVRDVEGAPVGVSATIGGVVFRRPPTSSEAAIRAADDRMYEGKRAGRDRLFLSEPDAAPATGPR